MKKFSSILLAITALFAFGTQAQNALPLSNYLPLTMNGQSSGQPMPTNPPTDILAMRREVIGQVNEYRIANGCPAAPETAALMNGAQAWSDYMQANDYYEHSSMVDSEWYSRHGYTNASAIGVRENIGIGYDTAQAVVDGWKASPNHHRTLLSCYYASKGYVYDLGVGLNGRLWTLALGEHLP